MEAEGNVVSSEITSNVGFATWKSFGEKSFDDIISRRRFDPQMFLPVPLITDLDHFEFLPPRGWIESFTFAHPTSDILLNGFCEMEREVEEAKLLLEDENYQIRELHANETQE